MCTSPIILKNGIVINCGRCIQCRKSRINYWAQHLRMEGQDYGKNKLYLTLTYNEESLLKTGTLLDKKDYQNFLKRLRYYLKKYKRDVKIRYYVAGEYGSEKGRKHWHLIIFGLAPTYENQLLLKQCWPYGFICMEKCQGKVFYYVAKYCCKQLNRTKIDKITGQEKKEFTSQSQSIGFNFFKKNVEAFKQSIINSEKIVKIQGVDYYNCRLFKQWLKEKFKVKLSHPLKIFVYANTNRLKFDKWYYEAFLKKINNIIFDRDIPDGWDYSTMIKENIDYKDFYVLDYKDLYHKLEVNNQDELNFCKKHKKNYTDYYHKSSYERLNDFYNRVQQEQKFFFELHYDIDENMTSYRYVDLQFKLRDKNLDNFVFDNTVPFPHHNEDFSLVYDYENQFYCKRSNKKNKWL